MGSILDDRAPRGKKRSNNYKWMSGAEQYWGESSPGTWLGESPKTARDTRQQAEGGVFTEPWRREAAWLGQGTTACSVAVTTTSQFMLLSTKVAKVIIPLKGHDNMLRSLQWVSKRILKSQKSLPVSTPKAASTWRAKWVHLYYYFFWDSFWGEF